MPRSIVIGIVNTDRMRDFTPVATEISANSGGADKFLQFMEKELLQNTIAFRKLWQDSRLMVV